MSRGDVYLVMLNPARGDEIRNMRPCLVVSPDELNNSLNTLIVAPSSHDQRDPREGCRRGRLRLIKTLLATAESASERRYYADRAGMGRSYCLWSRSSFSLRFSSFRASFSLSSSFRARFFLKILVASSFLNRSAITAIPSTAFTLNRARRPSDTHRDASISEFGSRRSRRNSRPEIAVEPLFSGRMG